MMTISELIRRYESAVKLGLPEVDLDGVSMPVSWVYTYFISPGAYVTGVSSPYVPTPPTGTTDD